MSGIEEQSVHLSRAAIEPRIYHPNREISSEITDDGSFSQRAECSGIVHICSSTADVCVYLFKGNTNALALGIKVRGRVGIAGLLLWHRVVEFCVVEEETTLRRNTGDVLIPMLPADIAPGIDVTRIELLGGAIIDATDIEH